MPLGVLISALLELVPQVVPDPALTSRLCDVHEIFAKTFRKEGQLRHASRIRGAFSTKVAVNLTREGWSFRVYLRSRWFASMKPWTTDATTCEQAAQRSAFKLIMVTESLLENSLSPRRPRPAPNRPEPLAVAETVHEGRPAPTTEPTKSDTPPSHIARPLVPEPPTGLLYTAPPPPLAEPPALTRAEPRPVRRRRIPIGLRLRTDARVGHGVLPQPVFGGAAVHAALVAGHARVELGLAVNGAGPLVVTGDDRTRRPYHLGLELRGCGELTRGALDLRLCLGLQGGLVVATRAVQTDPAWTLHLTGAPSLTWWFSRHVGLYTGVMAGPTLVRSNFYLGTGPGAYAVGERGNPRYLVGGSFGMEVRVPTM